MPQLHELRREDSAAAAAANEVVGPETSFEPGVDLASFCAALGGECSQSAAARRGAARRAPRLNAEDVRGAVEAGRCAKRQRARPRPPPLRFA